MIRATHRRLVRALHPDRNPDPRAHAKFRDVQKAYVHLRDPCRRAELDRGLREADAVEQARGDSVEWQRRRAAEAVRTAAAQAARSRREPETPRHSRDEWRAQVGSAPIQVSADEAAAWLVGDLAELGPPPPAPPRPVRATWDRPLHQLFANHLAQRIRLPISLAVGVLTAATGTFMMGYDTYPLLGATLLLASPFAAIATGAALARLTSSR